jgi:hypothetical protein
LAAAAAHSDVAFAELGLEPETVAASGPARLDGEPNCSMPRVCPPARDADGRHPSTSPCDIPQAGPLPDSPSASAAKTFDSRVGPRAKGSLKSVLLVHEVAGHQVSTWPRPCWARSWMTRHARDPRPQTWTKKTA